MIITGRSIFCWFIYMFAMKIPFTTFQPDMDQLLRVLRRERTDRPVLFEFIINLATCQEAAEVDKQPPPGSVNFYRMVIDAFRNLG